MTPDQFQREVMDILDLYGRGDDEKIVMAETLIRKAAGAQTNEESMRRMATSLAVYANAMGYSLETIFQMALDQLEGEYGRVT
jgi:hypothetical protein